RPLSPHEAPAPHSPGPVHARGARGRPQQTLPRAPARRPDAAAHVAPPARPAARRSDAQARRARARTRARDRCRATRRRARPSGPLKAHRSPRAAAFPTLVSPHSSATILPGPAPGHGVALKAMPGVTEERMFASHPTEIGPYRVLEVLGQGGVGNVYLVQQREPFRRKAALKLIKLGMDTREVLVRFAQERQMLASMNHPNIAKVFDAGQTETGRPYFVMEYVPGEPITDYCDRHRLSVSERLELFVTVCRAIQHAHQRGILHRDVKPSNLLVANQDGKHVPMVIDFGLAKVLRTEPSSAHLLTRE